MKKVLIIGASGSLATVVIEELKKQNDVELTLLQELKTDFQHRKRYRN
ncbi:MAG: hypothetical protein IPI42_16370 [Saprospiraceae bacterium]|nr:hypothetical protein [Candidatus Parvibacillus calidus]